MIERVAPALWVRTLCESNLTGPARLWQSRQVATRLRHSPLPDFYALTHSRRFFNLTHGCLPPFHGLAALGSGLSVRNGTSDNHTTTAPRTPRLAGRKSFPRPLQHMRCETLSALHTAHLDSRRTDSGYITSRVPHVLYSHPKEQPSRSGSPFS